MKISSPFFTNNEKIPSIFTCDGISVNPPLFFENIPDGAKSLALVVFDSDAPGGNFVHWLVYNIPATVSNIGQDSLPYGAKEGNTSLGYPGWIGPCPPSGCHRYHFLLYALDTELQIGKPNLEIINEAISGHILAEAELIGLYEKNKSK